MIVLDDILDEGMTLAAIVERLKELGAKACYTAVATEKLNGKKKPIKAEAPPAFRPTSRRPSA